ncbi:AraC family transcriptional regulator [Bradyrhizobium sp. 192]|uniref:AraC family transcriptional regulator n=1 Tax=Bradyrhizobium sp. 192 TaxID=2782660 RepID=UPI00200023ED|nr:AraC family transcriptional regulator [Bradyrhizobium sp. 192]UPJ60960.1 AraC family transcriptional regulator [Bradyrhizobium sp. 192]
MHEGSGKMLGRYKVFASRHLDETHAYMERGDHIFEVSPREADRLEIVSHLVVLPNAKMGRISYGSAVLTAARGDGPEQFMINFPLRGSSELANKKLSFECSPTRSAVTASTDGYVMRSVADSERLTFRVSKAAVMAQLAALLGEQPTRMLEFQPELDFETAQGRSLRRQVQLAIADLDEAGPERSSHLMLNMYEQLIVTGLLVNQKSNYTEALLRLKSEIAPGDVKRAIDFIEAHLHLPITLADIAEASGVPGRTLLEHFRNHRSVSPMQYVRSARLAKVREALVRTDFNGSVTEIAMEWGFNHLGRFAFEYRDQFGESPSETLKRGRGRK